MTTQAVLTLVGFLVVLVALAQPLAAYITRLADAAPLATVFGRIERIVYRAAGDDAASDMR